MLLVLVRAPLGIYYHTFLTLGFIWLDRRCLCPLPPQHLGSDVISEIDMGDWSSWAGRRTGYNHSLQRGYNNHRHINGCGIDQRPNSFGRNILHDFKVSWPRLVTREILRYVLEDKTETGTRFQS